MLHQDWFLSAQLKGMGVANGSVFGENRAFEIMHCIHNAAAKFIRRFSHNKNLLIFLIYCIIISNNCVKYVSCDIEPQPMNNMIDDDDDDDVGIAKDLNAHKHLPSVNKPDTINIDETNNKSNADTLIGNVGFLHAFVETLSMILFSELGDKTFFIAAIMAMRHARLIVFTGAIAALILMTILSSESRHRFQFMRQSV